MWLTSRRGGMVRSEQLRQSKQMYLIGSQGLRTLGSLDVATTLKSDDYIVI